MALKDMVARTNELLNATEQDLIVDWDSLKPGRARKLAALAVGSVIYARLSVGTSATRAVARGQVYDVARRYKIRLSVRALSTSVIAVTRCE